MTAQPSRPSGTLDVFLVAAEESGDRLGAALIRALRERAGGAVGFSGVGGREMAAEGVASLYSIDDFSIIGFSAIPRRIPKILSLMRFTARAVVARRPDVLVVIDSPGFTRGIARRVRAADPSIPIVEYVSPSVWAWRPGRAGDAGLHRSHPRAAAVRARGAPAARRPALHLCRPPAGG